MGVNPHLSLKIYTLFLSLRILQDKIFYRINSKNQTHKSSHYCQGVNKGEGTPRELKKRSNLEPEVSFGG